MATMATEDDIMQRWGFLEPWLSVLRRQYTHGMYRRQHSPFEPVQFYVCINLPDEAQTTQEGLKLLTAVAHVDYNAWKKLLFCHGFMKVGEYWEQDTDNGTIARHQLRIHTYGGTVHDLVQMCGIRQHDHPRREYSEALARIAAMDVKYDAKRCGVEIPVPVVAFVTKDVSPDELLKLRDTQRTLRYKRENSSLPTVQPGGLGCSFVLAAVSVNLEDFYCSSIGLDVATKMQQLLYENVWFSKLFLRLDFDYEVTRVKKEVYGRLLAGFFGTTRHLKEPPIQFWEAHRDTSIVRQQIDHLSLYLLELSRNDMEAICSAAIQSQTVRKLELAYTAKSSDSVHWWKWIAYAFFSRRARTLSSLEGLAIRKIVRMSTEEIDAFCGILASENSEKELLGSDLREATLTANSPIQWEFDQFSKSVLHSEVIEFPSPIPFVWVMSSSEKTEWVDALVPGYGRCQVRRQDLIFNDPVNRTTPGNGLTSLEIHFDRYYIHNRDLGGLPHFLAAVGSTLKMLTIDAKYEYVDVEMVLERCPHLEKLCFHKGRNTAIFNFSEYQAAGSPVPIFPFRFDDILAFTKELMNPDSDLTKCLQRLTIHPSYCHYGGTYQQKLDALLEMLETNGRLEYLFVQQVKSEMYVEKFKKFHLQPINRSVKLDTRSKIAFLSVLSTTSVPQSEKKQCQTRVKRGNWDNFDSNVVTNVFQFAAAPLLRKVYVENDQ